MRKFFLIISTLVISIFLYRPVYAIPFTQADRDRLVRLEIRVEEGQKSVQIKINDLRTLLLWGFGILFGGMGIIIGYVTWDRRTALKPE